MTIRNERLARVAAEQQNDSDIKAIIEVSNNNVAKNNVLNKVHDGSNLPVILWKMQTDVIWNTHTIDHFGVAKTEALVNHDYSTKVQKEQRTNFNIRRKSSKIYQLGDLS